ncbi:MAG: glycosyltransferase family 4 protein [Chlamydiales bacterium]|nr:glycosyltransferase family 4 protein [Chlamydiales bacterium]
MKILHTESSGGFGGQEIRILREAEGMRDRGHEVIMAVQSGGDLVQAAREAGFLVYEVSFSKKRAMQDLFALVGIIKRHNIDIVNTHSSWDAWLGGVAAKVTGRRIIRTRHLSTSIRPGINSRLLYRFLADQVVTTCETTANVICRQAGLTVDRCRSIPTGVAENFLPDNAANSFRQKFKIQSDEIVVGTVCVLRSWKGVQHLLQAAKILEGEPRLRWLIVGDGPAKEFLEHLAESLQLGGKVIFTGYQPDPMSAIAAMDIFALLSTANEGVSQASLQAALLGKPLVTTDIGGLGEVCIEGQTGYKCPEASPADVAIAIKQLADNPQLRQTFGANARHLALGKFTLKSTLDEMEKVYGLLQEA